MFMKSVGIAAVAKCLSPFDEFAENVRRENSLLAPLPLTDLALPVLIARAARVAPSIADALSAIGQTSFSDQV